MKYIDYVRKEFAKPEFPVFRTADVRLALEGRGAGDGYLNLMMHNLVRKKEIRRVTRGTYTFHHDTAVVGFAFAPFYYGMENALSLRGLSEQGANFVVMTARNVRTGVRAFEGRNYRIQRVDERHFFGYSLIKHGDYWIPVADPEKTLIDMVYLGGYLTEDIVNDTKDIIDRKKLGGYLQRYGAEFRKTVERALK